MLRRFCDWLALNWARNWLADGNRIAWSGRSWLARTLEFNDLRVVAERGGPLLAPYERLAACYESYGDRLAERYPSYLRRLAAYHRQPWPRVLDLACGCGGLARTLAKGAERVVGLDSSPDMLAVARAACRDVPHVEFVQADFRDFDLGEAFDVALCTNDALNYLPEPAALGDLFAATARHLRPGGLFLFDVMTDEALQTLSGLHFHHENRDVHFALSFNYDAQARRERTDVIFPDGLEQHVRIPIDAADVLAAAAATGFTAIDEFHGSWRRLFFALQRSGEPSQLE